ncbi:hypothetical protein I4F81_011281 [Pyropia yezoensis]|uniref:Uncharacterized protein n=1 Tax=Pyropia yezoensis TaxID=2788 RepID=A0ACC3CG07_PYRYE|nr:hypothetical protein I4F81_011281 [Neopyropia yezoensis]
MHTTFLSGTPMRVFDTPGIPDDSRRRRTMRKVSRALAVSADSCMHLLLYVVRLDDAAAGGAEAAAMREVTAALSPDVWSRTVVVATHAHSTPPAGLRYYDRYNPRASLRSLRSARSGASSTSSLYDAAASTVSIAGAAHDPDAYARAHLPLPPEMALMEHGLTDDDGDGGDGDADAAAAAAAAAAPDGTPWRLLPS